MKKLFGCVLALFTALVVYADGNNISMVTYFPVPYVAYNRVQAAQQMDIGLTANGGQLSLGTPTSLTAPLTAGTTRVTGGMLNLTFNNAVTENNRYIKLTDFSNPLSLGVGQDAANLNFANLRIGTVSKFITDTEGRPGSGISSINTNELVVDGLQLFGKDFPSCAAVNADSSGNGQIAWKKLALGTDNKQEIYLTCGTTNTCPLPKPKDTDPCNVQEWVNSLSVGPQLGGTYDELRGENDPHPFSFCNGASYGNCNWTILRNKLNELEGNSYLLCGQQVRDYVCNLDANPPAWAPGDTWDRSACRPQKKQVKELISSCQNYFDNSGADISFLNGWTLEGNVYRVINHTKDADGSCSLANPVISTSECVATKVEWRSQGYDNSYTFRFKGTPANVNNFDHMNCSPTESSCQEGPRQNYTCNSQADIDAGGDTGRWRDYIEKSGIVDWARCTYYNKWGQQLVGYTNSPTAVFECRKRIDKCVKRCHDVRLYEYDNGEKYATFVNSERNCD